MSIDLISKRISKFLATNMRQEIDRAIAALSCKRMREIEGGDMSALFRGLRGAGTER